MDDKTGKEMAATTAAMDQCYMTLKRAVTTLSEGRGLTLSQICSGEHDHIPCAKKTREQFAFFGASYFQMRRIEELAV